MSNRSKLLLGFIVISMFSSLGAKITIIKAEYGIMGNKKKMKDVTDKLKKLVGDKNSFTINAREYNNLFGDPAKGAGKSFFVVYNDGVRQQYKEANEGESLTLSVNKPSEPEPSKPEEQPITFTINTNPLTVDECHRLMQYLNDAEKNADIRNASTMDEVRRILGIEVPGVKFNFSDMRTFILLAKNEFKTYNIRDLVNAKGFNSVGDFLKFKVQAVPEYQDSIREKWGKFLNESIWERTQSLWRSTGEHGEFPGTVLAKIQSRFCGR